LKPRRQREKGERKNAFFLRSRVLLTGMSNRTEARTNWYGEGEGGKKGKKKKVERREIFLFPATSDRRKEEGGRCRPASVGREEGKKEYQRFSIQARKEDRGAAQPACQGQEGRKREKKEEPFTQTREGSVDRLMRGEKGKSTTIPTIFSKTRTERRKKKKYINQAQARRERKRGGRGGKKDAFDSSPSFALWGRRNIPLLKKKDCAS